MRRAVMIHSRSAQEKVRKEIMAKGASDAIQRLCCHLKQWDREFKERLVPRGLETLQGNLLANAAADRQRMRRRIRVVPSVRADCLVLWYDAAGIRSGWTSGRASKAKTPIASVFTANGAMTPALATQS